jgi:hypothetical protein
LTVRLSRVARFRISRAGKKIYPNEHKMHRMAIKHTYIPSFSPIRPSKLYTD